LEDVLKSQKVQFSEPDWSPQKVEKIPPIEKSKARNEAATPIG
jgi:hypothetical protein